MEKTTDKDLKVDMPVWAVQKIEAIATATGKTVDEVCAIFLGLEVVHT